MVLLESYWICLATIHSHIWFARKVQKYGDAFSMSSSKYTSYRTPLFLLYAFDSDFAVNKRVINMFKASMSSLSDVLVFNQCLRAQESNKT